MQKTIYVVFLSHRHKKGKTLIQHVTDLDKDLSDLLPIYKITELYTIKQFRKMLDDIGKDLPDLHP
jgi:hypothetical protein